MLGIPRALAAALLALLVLVLVPAADAATPASGTVSLAAPTTAWTGQAAGYAVVAAHSVGAVRTCEAPTCDRFALTLADTGDLTLSATALKSSGFTEVGIIKPDGTRVTADGSDGNPTTALTVKNLPKGAYTAYVLTNAPATTGGDYEASATLAPSQGYSGPAPAPAPGTGPGGIGDATVIAVLDSGINPYHWDFLASRMPQQRNADTGDDMPLDRPASQWLSGFGATSGFASFDRVDLTLEENDATQRNDELRAVDADKWEAVEASAPEALHAYWFPGTKVIGAMTFRSEGQILGADDDHGVGTTSSAVGNLHGTCPECLLFFIQTSGDPETDEKAIDWAMRQPWIDAISNSYGFGSNSVYGRDRVYAGSNTTLQRTASERGQTVFFSAGNGIENAFLIPNQTTFSSQEGPDWIVTVGAVSPGPDNTYEPIVTGDLDANGPYLGAGKPVDVAGVGSDYPTAYGAARVGDTGDFGFGGTSNATPQVTGLYGRTLYLARKALKGDSRSQSGGVVARGKLKSGCGAARPGCELGDDALTANELRTRLFGGAVHHDGGLTVSGLGLGDVSLPKVGEEILAGEGHGAYLGRVDGGKDSWLAEQERVFGPLIGAAGVLQRPPGERDWFVVDSYCRQRNWGAWRGGYYVAGQTRLPPDSADWPIRTARSHTCPGGPVIP